MPQIIKPNLRPIKRMEITLDATGQAEINTKNLLTGGPLQPMEVILHMLQISVSMLSAMTSNNVTARKVISGDSDGADDTKNEKTY